MALRQVSLHIMATTLAISQNCISLVTTIIIIVIIIINLLLLLLLLLLLPLSINAYTKPTYYGWCTDQISKNPHMFPGGVKNKWVGFTCPLGPHLRMDNTCSPMSLIDDLLFDLFILGSYLVVHTYVHSVAGYFSKTIWNSPLCTLCTRALHGKKWFRNRNGSVQFVPIPTRSEKNIK